MTAYQEACHVFRKIARRKSMWLSELLLGFLIIFFPLFFRTFSSKFKRSVLSSVALEKQQDCFDFSEPWTVVKQVPPPQSKRNEVLISYTTWKRLISLWALKRTYWLFGTFSLLLPPDNSELTLSLPWVTLKEFSLQYQYDIKQTSDKNKEKYQLGDWLSQ